METLSTTEPHYIRCVKPNTVLKPGIFENFNVLNQLRCGVCMFNSLYDSMFCTPIGLITAYRHGAGCSGSNSDQLCWLSNKEDIR
jgi:hypothetical protein